MDVSVGGVVLQRRYEPVEVIDRNVLRGGPDYICGRKRAGHRPTIGWAGLSSLRSVRKIRAEKHNDATGVGVNLRTGRPIVASVGSCLLVL